MINIIKQENNNLKSLLKQFKDKLFYINLTEDLYNHKVIDKKDYNNLISFLNQKTIQEIIEQ